MRQIVLVLILAGLSFGFALPFGFTQANDSAQSNDSTHSKPIKEYISADRYLIQRVVETANAQYELTQAIKSANGAEIYAAYSNVEAKNDKLMGVLAYRRSKGISSEIFSDETIAELYQWSLDIEQISLNAIAELQSKEHSITIGTLILLFGSSNKGLDLIR